MSQVKIVEVGPRDGLQNISQTVPTNVKIELIQRLALSGLSVIEATSFVSPKWIPQLADGREVMAGIKRLTESGDNQIQFPVLVPNARGLEDAQSCSVREVAVFISATEGFSQKNINCTVEESLIRVREVTRKAKQLGILIRGYVSCIFEDPYDGPTAPGQVIKVTQALLDAGCYEVSLGDTTGVGTPADVVKLLGPMLKSIPAGRLAGHFHDTYGQAVANVVKAYEMGLRTFDSSVAGLGGCPFARGAKGNVSTEDLVYTFQKLGVATGVNLNELVATGVWISSQLGIPNGSRAGLAIASKLQAPTKPSTQLGLAKDRDRKLWRSSVANDHSVYRSGATINIRLTRPKVGNALTNSLILALIQLYKDFSVDDGISRIVLSSEGKFFCTGMDLKSSGTSEEQFENFRSLFHVIDTCPKTTIAAIQGPCFGGGVGLAFVCDIRLATANTTFKLSEVRLGLSAATISKYIVREWGFSLARSSMLTAVEINASDLAAVHIIHRVVANQSALDAVLGEVLDNLRFNAPKASAMSKELVTEAWLDPGGPSQAKLIKSVFGKMMAEGSESKIAREMFANGIKGVDWESLTVQRPLSKL